MSAQRSSSFRIVELVAVVVIALFLVALLLPMLQVGRDGHSSRNTCINNLRQCALGLVSYEQMHGTFPGYANTIGGKRASWVVPILPMLEQMQLYRNWNNQDLPYDLRPTDDGGRREQLITHQFVLICRWESEDADQSIDRLSYVVNSGSARTANDFAPPLSTPLDWIEDVNSGVCFSRARADYDPAIKQPNRIPHPRRFHHPQASAWGWTSLTGMTGPPTRC